MPRRCSKRIRTHCFVSETRVVRTIIPTRPWHRPHRNVVASSDLSPIFLGYKALLYCECTVYHDQICHQCPRQPYHRSRHPWDLLWQNEHQLYRARYQVSPAHGPLSRRGLYSLKSKGGPVCTSRKRVNSVGCNRGDDKERYSRRGQDRTGSRKAAPARVCPPGL